MESWFMVDGLAVIGQRAWWDYPGLELWKFVNLLIFFGVGAYILHRPLSDAFMSRRDSIRRRLQMAREEMEQARLKLEEIESRLTQLDSEVEKIRLQARAEAAAEWDRIARETEAEVARLRSRTERDLERSAAAARRELQRAAVQQCVDRAGEILQGELQPKDDDRLIMVGIKQLGRGGS